MSKRAINPAELPKPVGFAHGWLVEGGGRTLYLAGQCAYDRDGAIRHPGDLVGQVRAALENLGRVLGEAGMELTDVVQLNLYVRSRDDHAVARGALGEVWNEVCGRHYPAMALFQVAGLYDPDALVEIQGVAAQ